MSGYCPGLPDELLPCGRVLLPPDTAGLCIACELRAEQTHGITITAALRDTDDG